MHPLWGHLVAKPSTFSQKLSGLGACLLVALANHLAPAQPPPAHAGESEPTETAPRQANGVFNEESADESAALAPPMGHPPGAMLSEDQLQRFEQLIRRYRQQLIQRDEDLQKLLKQQRQLAQQQLNLLQEDLPAEMLQQTSTPLSLRCQALRSLCQANLHQAKATLQRINARQKYLGSLRQLEESLLSEQNQQPTLVQRLALLICQTHRAQAETALHRERFPQTHPEELAPLAQRVRVANRIYQRVVVLWQAAAVGGEEDRLALAAIEFCQARAELAQACGDAHAEWASRQAAAVWAQRALEIARAKHQAGQQALDLWIGVSRRREELVRQWHATARRLQGIPDLPMLEQALARQMLKELSNPHQDE